MVAKKRLGEMLIEAGVIDESQLRAALGYQRQWGVRLGQALVELKLATEPDVVRALAQRFGYEVAAISAAQGYALEQALKLVPREFALKNNLLPLQADTASLTVAMSDPGNVAVADELRFRTGRRVKIRIGGDREIAEAIRRVYPGDPGVEPIALDLDAGDPGEAVLDPFGGGSNDTLDAFYGPAGAESPPAPAAPPAAAAPAPVPPVRAASPAGHLQPGGRPAAAPRPAAPTQPAMPAQPAPRVASPPPPRAPTPAVAAVPSPAATRTLLDDLDLEVPRPASPRPASSAAPATRTAPPAQAVPPAAKPEPALEPIPDGEPILATDLAPADDEASTLSPRELALLDALGKMAAGAPVEPELVKPAQAVAALLRILLRKRIVTEEELAEELGRR